MSTLAGKFIQRYHLRRYIEFFLLVGITVILTYRFTPQVASVWYVLLLIAYFRSADESFWLVFFLITHDGFMGAFGPYSTVITIIPGLPGIEIAQFYILLTILKVLLSGRKVEVFYGGWMMVLMLYTIFLVAYGYGVGLNGDVNLYFRIGKMILPLMLFYTLPRLMPEIDDFVGFFRLLFPVFILGFALQIYTMISAFNVAEYFRQATEDDIEIGRNFRKLYNPTATLLSLLGALYFLTIKGKRYFHPVCLYGIVCLTFLMAFFSATRGWIISLGFIIFLYFLIIEKLNPRQLAAFSVIAIAMMILALSSNAITRQIEFSIERLTTLNALASGDLSADGTLIRLDERSPAVMSVWWEYPVFGVGFSGLFFDKADGHVANQNVLLHSGVVGLLLMLAFFALFVITMYVQYRDRLNRDAFKMTFLFLCIFLAGWFMLHSSSGQQFAYYGLPGDIIPCAVFLTLAAVTYNQPAAEKHNVYQQMRMQATSE